LAQKLPLCVTIITYNEEKDLPKTLESIKDIASEIVIVDSHSTDKTVEIAKSYGAKVYIEDWKGFGKQKNSAIEKCTQPWIFSLDADEIVSPELKKSIIEAIKNPKYDCYEVNRRNFYLGKFIEHVWYPEWRLRLFKNGKGKFEGDIHETLKCKGTKGRLEGFLYHYPYKDLEEHYTKSIKYAKLSAETEFKKGKRFKIYQLFLNPFWAFFKMYFLKKGFLDGIRGLSIAKSNSYAKFLKYLFLWELEEKNKNAKS
jgi:glycosyltransferase involved in cell wall biosynthesis